jgi:hypothetical protein
MPRLVEYPRASFKNGQELANAVDYMGGSCTRESCAEKMNKKPSGGFRDIISAGLKHGLIMAKGEMLQTTELFRNLKLAYNEDEKMKLQLKAFLFPPLYQKLYERFKNKDLPIAMLQKLLIRELGVEEGYSSRVANYFVEGAKSIGILENGKLLDKARDLEMNTENSDLPGSSLDDPILVKKTEPEQAIRNLGDPITNTYAVVITGPGMNLKIEIKEDDDLLILEAMINKIRRKLKE